MRGTPVWAIDGKSRIRHRPSVSQRPDMACLQEVLFKLVPHRQDDDAAIADDFAPGHMA